MHISRSSNYSAELDKVKSFYTGLETIDKTYKTTIVPLQDKITGFSCSNWTDNVGDQMLTLIKGIKEDEIVTLDDNQTIGGFKQLVNNTVALKDALGNCVTCAAQIRNDESTMTSEARKKKEGEDYSSLYYSAKRDKESTEKALDGHIANANNLIANYPNIHFNGVGFQIDQGAQEDTSSGKDDPVKDEDEAKRQQYISENSHYTIYYKDQAYHRNEYGQYGEPYEVLVEREVSYVKDGSGNWKIVVNDFTRDSQGNKVGYDGNVPVPGELYQSKVDWNDYGNVEMITTTVDGVTFEYPCLCKDGGKLFVPPHP